MNNIAANYKIDFVASFSGVEANSNKSIVDELINLIAGSENIKLSNPASIVAKDSSTILILDQGLQNVILYNLKYDEIKMIESKIEFPSLISAIAFKGDRFLFTDSKAGTIYTFDINSDEIQLLNDTLKLNRPTGIIYLASKNEIWVVETGAHRISILNEKGEFINFIGKHGSNKHEFNFPTNIWKNNSEHIYVVDALNFRIQIYNSDGKYLSMFGEQGDATGYFARPKGVATDTFGNIYVVDALFHTVQVFNNEGLFLTNFGSQGTSDGEFWMPNGIFIDDNNRIYVADSYNSRIQIFQLTKHSYD